MNTLSRLLRGFYTIYAFILFVVIMLLIMPFVVMASFFGRIRGGNMIFILCRIWADLWFFLIGMPFKFIYETPHDKSKAYIFVTNHTSYLDAAMIPKAFRQPVRPLGKVEMSKVPLFGFIYRNTIVTVDRNNPGDRAKSVRVLKSLLNKSISVLVFPEGTFNMSGKPLKDFYDGAFKIAIETQTPIKPVLFLDSYARMPHEHIMHMSPGRNRIVYLEEIPVSMYERKDAATLKEQVHKVMEKKLVEYKAALVSNFSS